MKLFRFTSVLAVLAIVISSTSLDAQDDKKKGPKQVYPVAVFPFAERSSDVKDLGTQVSDLLFASLVVNPDMYLVEREEISKLLNEQELNLSGLVNPDQATKVGQFTGAKILVTGSVLLVGDNLYVVAKVIGTETTRVLGASAKGDPDGDLDELVTDLAKNVVNTIDKRAEELVAKPLSREDRIAALNKALGKGKRPSVYIDIDERHVGQVTIDPAAETELALFCTELGFEVIDPDEGDKSDADLLLLGEGFSEFATRHQNLVSVKARLEIKAVDRRTAQVKTIDRETTVAVDLTEQIAGKTALQDGAARIASRILPRLVDFKDKKKGKNKKKNGKK